MRCCGTQLALVLAANAMWAIIEILPLSSLKTSPSPEALSFRTLLARCAWNEGHSSELRASIDEFRETCVVGSLRWLRGTRSMLQSFGIMKRSGGAVRQVGERIECSCRMESVAQSAD